jgi:hypothetical protein
MNGEDEDRAPWSPPYVITIFWTVGDSLEVNCGDLQSWEALALLEQAAETIRDSEQADAAAEGEDADA